MQEYVIDVVSDSGVPFRVVYGQREYLNGELSEHPVVSFYDRRYMHTPYGQFVSDYCRETLLDRDKNYGLDLCGGVADWALSRNLMQIVCNWLDALPVL